MGLRLVPSLFAILPFFVFIDATRFVCFLDEYWGIYRTGNYIIIETGAQKL